MTKNLQGIYCLIIASSLLMGCASSYQEIKPSALTFQSKTEDNSVKIEYQTNLLNGKYAANEIKTGVTLVAVKISNNTGHDLVVRDNIKIYAGEKELTGISLNDFYELTRQNANKSLLFLALTPVNAYSSQQTTSGSEITSQSTKFYPVGLILGPALAFGNQAAANSANKRFRKELEDNEILGKTIPPGQTAYGLIALRTEPLQTLIFKIAK
jgi:hypothetical protein